MLFFVKKWETLHKICLKVKKNYKYLHSRDVLFLCKLFHYCNKKLFEVSHGCINIKYPF